RQRRRLVDEILIAGEPSLHVTRQALDSLLLLSNRPRHRQIAIGEWNADRRADADRAIEQTEQDADREYNEQGCAAGAAPARSEPSPAVPLRAHVSKPI